MTTLRWAIADTWTMTGRDLMHWARQPGAVVVMLLFPALVLLMFGYLFGGQMSLGGSGYREFLVPGVFAMTMVFGLETTMLAVSTDASRGVTDRFRSISMSPVAVVGGRSVADLLNSVVGLAVMIGCGLAIGWRTTGFVGAGQAIGLLLLLRFALIWFGVWLGLVVKGPESVVAVQILVWPIGFLSSAYVSPATMPGWLGAVAQWNPLSATVDATRSLFGNPMGDDGSAASVSWAVEHSVFLATAWPLVMLAVFVPLSVRRYRALGH